MRVLQSKIFEKNSGKNKDGVRKEDGSKAQRKGPFKQHLCLRIRWGIEDSWDKNDSFIWFFQIQKTQMNIVIVPRKQQRTDVSQLSQRRNPTVLFPDQEGDDKVSLRHYGKVVSGS